MKVSLALHQICILISPRAFWKSAELQDFTHQSHIPCSPQGKRLLQASFGRRACSSKEARWVLGLSSSFPTFRYEAYEALDAFSNHFGQSGISLLILVDLCGLFLAARRERRCISPALSWIWDSNLQMGGSGELLWVVWRCLPPQSAPLLLEEGITCFSPHVHWAREACKVLCQSWTLTEEELWDFSICKKMILLLHKSREWKSPAYFFFLTPP